MGIVDEFILNGFSRAEEDYLNSFNFSEFYIEFNKFIQCMETGIGKIIAKQTAEEWNSGSLLDYMNTQPGFKDKRGISGIEPRVYFWGTAEYAMLMREKMLESQIDSGTKFLCAFSQLYELCNTIFHDCTESIISDGMSVRCNRQLYNGSGKLSFYLRILRYDASNGITANPHYDKSVLSLNLHSSDKENCFVIGKKKNPVNFNWANYSSPNVGNTTKPIVYPGLCFSECFETGIEASPHAVLKFNNGKNRFACVAFLFLPEYNSQLMDERVEGWKY
jgi:2OG-Fe(II) oxygenase superfamily